MFRPVLLAIFLQLTSFSTCAVDASTSVTQILHVWLNVKSLCNKLILDKMYIIQLHEKCIILNPFVSFISETPVDYVFAR